MSETEKQTGEFETSELPEEHALSRVFVVSLIQIVGVSLTIALVKFGPRWALRGYGFRALFRPADEAGWQQDCLAIAYFLGANVVLLFLVFGFTYIRRWRPGIPEGIILFTFVVNIIAFSLAMARTGGPSHSFFGQLVPMQLSGILILEQQEAMTTSRTSSTRKRAWYYAAFTVFIWLIVWLFPMRFAALFGWKQMTIETSVKSYEDFAATVLFILGMLVTAFAYWVTPRRAASFRRPKPRQAA